MASFPSPLFVVLPEEGGGVSPRLLAAVIAALDTQLNAAGWTGAAETRTVDPEIRLSRARAAAAFDGGTTADGISLTSAEFDPVDLAVQGHVFEQTGMPEASAARWAAAIAAAGGPGVAPPEWEYECARMTLVLDASRRLATRGMGLIDRRAAGGLSTAEFRRRYSRAQRAVVITGLGAHLTSAQGEAWLLGSVANKRVGVYKNGTHRQAKPDVDFMQMREYLQLLKQSESGHGDPDPLYLYDTSIPKSLPSLLEHLRIPRYFCHDYITQTVSPTPWAKNWPSLFVGAKGSSSSLHLDQWHGSFWMVMVYGRKRWVMFHPDDVHLLYPDWTRGTLAPAFPPLVALEENPAKYPAFRQARRVEVIVSAGEVLFVPGGTPHFVENLDTTIAYAGNYVDEANLDRVLDDVRILGHIDPACAAAQTALDQVEFDPDLGVSEQCVAPQHLVVPYEDYASGVAAAWPPEPALNASFDPAEIGGHNTTQHMTQHMTQRADDDAVATDGDDESGSDDDHAVSSNSDDDDDDSDDSDSDSDAESSEGSASSDPDAVNAGDTAVLIESLNDDGYVILRNAIPASQLEGLRLQLQSELYANIENEQNPPGHPDSVFAKINSRKQRHDLRLMLDGQVMDAVRSIVTSSHGGVYAHVLPGDAPLVELGVITSQPGAEQQVIHADITYDQNSRKVFTTFVPLQDITKEMGPTKIWPGTHSGYWCEFYKPRMLGPVDPYYDKNPAAEMALQAGDVVLMDTRVMHCGGKNRSAKDRMLFHFSFETTVEPNPPIGFTYNLMPALKGKHTIGTIRE